jgi:chemotaxis protein MotB
VADDIIIKKVKKVMGGHHGGAWKVAYADFVTAMMAFFLLMWLLSSVPQETLAGIADYFTPTIGLKDGKGIGFDGGLTPQNDGAQAGNPKSNQSVVFGAPSKGNVVKSPEERLENDFNDFFSLSQTINDGINKDEHLSKYKEHLIVDQTEEGLRIQIIDTKGRAIFKKNSTELEEFAKRIVAKITNLIRFMPNYLAVYAHTKGFDQTIDHWQLSTMRALTGMKEMKKNALDEEQFSKISGKANRELLIIDNPAAPQNSRLSIILLKR